MTQVTYYDTDKANPARQAKVKALLAKPKLPFAPIDTGPATPNITRGSFHPRKLPELTLPDTGELKRDKLCRGINLTVTDGNTGIVSRDDTGMNGLMWIPLNGDTLPWEDVYAAMHKSTRKPFQAVTWRYADGRTTWTHSNRLDDIESKAWLACPGVWDGVEPFECLVDSSLAWAWRGADAWTMMPGTMPLFFFRFPTGYVVIAGMVKH